MRSHRSRPKKWTQWEWRKWICLAKFNFKDSYFLIQHSETETKYCINLDENHVVFRLSFRTTWEGQANSAGERARAVCARGPWKSPFLPHLPRRGGQWKMPREMGPVLCSILAASWDRLLPFFSSRYSFPSVYLFHPHPDSSHLGSLPLVWWHT